MVKKILPWPITIEYFDFGHGHVQGLTIWTR